MLAACAKPVTIDSRLVAVTQTTTSTSLPFHMAWVNSTASWVFPVPPWLAGAVFDSSPCTSTMVWPG